MLKIALLSAAVELIRHLDLSNVLSEELTQFFSGFPALKGGKIFANCSYVPSCFVCHIVIMIRALACIVDGGSSPIRKFAGDTSGLPVTRQESLLLRD